MTELQAWAIIALTSVAFLGGILYGIVLYRAYLRHRKFLKWLDGEE